MRLKRLNTVSVATVIAVLLPVTARAETVAVDEELLRQLQQIIEQQQEQLKQQSDQLKFQAGTIEVLKDRVDQLEEVSSETQAIATEAQTAAEQAIGSAQQAGSLFPERTVTSGSDKVKLSVSGQVNRAVNIVDDGDETEAFFVDNDTSNTRVRFVGTGKVDEETTLGTVIEVGLSPNNSFDVSQDNETADDFIDLRKADITLRNDSYGQLLFGKGQAAADDTAEYDLSLVAGPIMYSGVSDIVGGIQFTNDGALTGITVGSAFFNFDGNRQDRVRYDSPILGPGVQLSVSAGSDSRYDAALTWGGDYGDWTGVDIGEVTTLGAISIRDPDVDNVDYRVAGSFSALHNPTGLSATVSAGSDFVDEGDDPFNLYGKLAWDTTFFDVGPTGFGVDFTYSENVSGQGDEGRSVGLSAIQLFEEFGTELYVQVRGFDLERGSGDDPDNIIVGTTGARVKF